LLVFALIVLLGWADSVAAAALAMAAQAIMEPVTGAEYDHDSKHHKTSEKDENYENVSGEDSGSEAYDHDENHNETIHGKQTKHGRKSLEGTTIISSYVSCVTIHVLLSLELH